MKIHKRLKIIAGESEVDDLDNSAVYDLVVNQRAGYIELLTHSVYRFKGKHVLQFEPIPFSTMPSNI